MVIQCPECSTRFNLSDAKIKPTGVKVRCAKCRHIFTVHPEAAAEEGEALLTLPPTPPPAEPSPEATATDSSDSDDLWGGFVESDSEPDTDQSPLSARDEAVAPEAPAVEDVNIDELSLGLADLPEPEEEAPATETVESDDWDGFAVEDFGLTAAPAEADSATDAAEPLLTAPAEETIEEPPAMAAATAATEESTDTDETGAETADEFLIFAEEDTDVPAAAIAPEPEAQAPATETLEEGLSLDDFSFEEESPALAPSDPEEFSFAESGVDDFFFAEETANDAFSVAEAPRGTAKADEDIFNTDGVDSGFATDLFGRTTEEDDGFNFDRIAFGSENVSSAEAQAPARATESLQLAEQPAERMAPKRPEPAPEAATGFVPPPKVRRKSHLSSVLRIFLLLLLLLLAAAGYLIWQGGTSDLGQILQQLRSGESSEAPAAQIRLPLPNSFFATNKSVGQIFVVQGEAVNGYPETRSAISVKGMLHDDKKQIRMQQTVFCGNVLSPETLKTASFGQIEEAMNNQFGNALSNLNIPAGKAIPYMIVFRNIPQEVTQFTVEVADSKPGGQQ